MVETLTHVYTTQAEIERIWSARASLLRVDDNDDDVAETGVWDDVCWEATDAINLFCENWYDSADMVNNLWVRRQASWIGAFLLSQRRGNPAQFTAQYERIMEVLEKIGQGKMQIPRLAQRVDLTPAMSNYRIDHRYARKQIRVQQDISTGGTSGRQNPDEYLYDGIR